MGDSVRVHNTHLIVSAAGEVAAVYRKAHLFNVDVEGKRYFESESTIAGNEYVVCDTPVGRLGITTCYDLRFPVVPCGVMPSVLCVCVCVCVCARASECLVLFFGMNRLVLLCSSEELSPTLSFALFCYCVCVVVVQGIGRVLTLPDTRVLMGWSALFFACRPLAEIAARGCTRLRDGEKGSTASAPCTTERCLCG